MPSSSASGAAEGGVVDDLALLLTWLMMAWATSSGLSPSNNDWRMAVCGSVTPSGDLGPAETFLPWMMSRGLTHGLDRCPSEVPGREGVPGRLLKLGGRTKLGVDPLAKLVRRLDSELCILRLE